MQVSVALPSWRASRRFSAPPMTTLRQIRMRHAASLLAIGDLSVDQVGRIVGYNNRSGFFRAYSEKNVRC
ncbi:helix-turn-helix domain-containing protein [Ancylobacter dichloromethanicus]